MRGACLAQMAGVDGVELHGAHGYLMKHEPPAQIILAIRRLLEGKIVAGPAVIQRILQRTSQDPRTNPSHPLTTLTDRELEIYRLIGQGLSRGQIAGQLHLSVKTVESHRATIRRKLGLQNSTELLQHAILGQPQDRPTHRGKS